MHWSGDFKPSRSFRLVYTVSMAWTFAPLAAKSVRLRQSWKTSRYSPAPSRRRFAPSSAERSSAPQVIASTRGCLAISLARNGASGTSLTIGSKVVVPTCRPSSFSIFASFSPNFSRSSRLDTFGTTNISGLSAFMVISTSSSHSWVSKGLIRTHTVLSPHCVEAIHLPTSALACGFSAGKTESSRSMIRASARDASALSRNFCDPPGTKCKLLSLLAARRPLKRNAIAAFDVFAGSGFKGSEAERGEVKKSRKTYEWAWAQANLKRTSQSYNIRPLSVIVKHSQTSRYTCFLSSVSQICHSSLKRSLQAWRSV